MPPGMKSDEIVGRLLTGGKIGFWAWELETNHFFFPPERENPSDGETHEIPRSFAEWQSRIHPEDFPRVMAEVQNFIREPKPDHQVEFRLRHQSDAYRWVLSQSNLEFDAQGRPVWMFGSLIDITKRKNAEDALRRQGEVVKSIFETTPGFLALKDRQGLYWEVNAAFCRFLGKMRAEVIGKTDEDLFPPEEAKVYLDGDAEVMSSGVRQSLDQAVTGAAGKQWLHVVKSPVKDEAGEIVGVLCSVTDITARKRSEAVMAARLRLLQLSGQLPLNGLLRATLDEAEALTGSWVGFFHFVDANQIDLSLQAWSTNTTEKMCAAAGAGQHYPVDQAGVWVDCIRERRPVVHNDYASLPHRKGLPAGHAEVVRELVVPVMRGGRIQAILGVGNKQTEYVAEDIEAAMSLADLAWDIAERKRAEEALRASEERFRGYFDLGLIGMATTSPGKNWIHCNDRLCEILGYTREELRGMTWAELTHRDDLAADVAQFERVLRGEIDAYQMEKRFIRKDGSAVPTELSLRCLRREDGVVNHFVAMIQDCTERKRMEGYLRASEQRFRDLTFTMADWVWETDAQGQFGYTSESVRQLLGRPVEEVLGRTIFDFMAPAETERIRITLLEIWGKKAPFRDIEHTVLHRDGSVRHLLASGVPILDPAGGFSGYRGIGKDITEWRLAEQQLKESHHRLDLVLNNIPDPAWLKDAEGRFQAVNKAWLEFFGLLVEEVLGKTIRDLLPEPLSRPMVECDQAVVQKGQSTIRLEPLKNHRGQIRWFETVKAPLRDSSGGVRGIVGLARDITERKQAEEQLREKQRLDIVARLAGGVAHEFNNDLAAMILQLGFLKEKPGLDDETAEAYHDLHRCMNRAATLTRQLVMYSRQSVMQLKPLNLGDAVSGLLRMVGRIAGESIRVEFQCAGGLPQVAADVGLLEQCLMNLCLNSREAMPAGGRLTLAVQAVQFDEAQCQAHQDRRPGRFVCLSVADTGRGMEEATLARLFTPFFTTKDVGVGTGMGLPSVQGVVMQHKGWLEVESQPGAGSVFRIYLPALEPQKCDARSKNAGQPGRQLRRTILLVEDSPSLRRVLARYLDLQGYEVLEAEDGEAAQEWWSQRGPDISLLFTDMIMPGTLTGLELAQFFRAARPELKVIISSGYHLELAKLGLAADTDIMMLPKPYEAEDVGRSVRQCLGDE